MRMHTSLHMLVEGIQTLQTCATDLDDMPLNLSAKEKKEMLDHVEQLAREVARKTLDCLACRNHAHTYVA